MAAFKQIDFGTMDVEDELRRNLEIFDEAFCYPNNDIDKLINGTAYLIRGRKGDGKTAFLAKLRRMAIQNDELKCHQCFFETFNSVPFEKLTNNDLTGGKCYSVIWQCIILIEFIKFLEKEIPHIQVEEYVNLVDALRHAGFLQRESIQTTITTLESVLKPCD